MPEGCCAAAKELSCSFIEVEQINRLWAFGTVKPPGEMVIKVCHNVR